ncbi:hypothetical protein FoTM2_004553 [Fusarium oxysporum f. sp. vasinfectum]|uniref:Aminoglycoside phosphotransferase domain-containing protein n=1 Tax=Fusarium oxysporum f. sp. vasinfectum 25433 TaxID=1089449 RepID=X0L659_FUSOX|nr:hypothetical protein FOTG_15137 [Fusarium oxysporum f. sp. vasinfectum 25433]KAK2936607.1 hypothetical protein FoTM2_004553 [Fusarium oxysporum f. sp. vasinfectum]
MSSTHPDIDSKVQKALEGTKFQVSKLEKITGGSVNWIYKAELTIEIESLKILSPVSSFGNQPNDTHNFVVRTPKFYHFDQDSSTQPQCHELGKALGSWLRNFVAWSAQQVKHRDLVAQNEFGQAVRHMLNYAWLHERTKEYPGILNDVEDILTQVEQLAASEKENTDELQIIHGDFWTGNVVLPDAAIKEGTKIPVFVVDWEMTQLGLPSVDFGEMITEMYALWLYKSIDAGLWMMEGFIEGYGHISEEFAFRTAIHVGTHLVCVTTDFPAWGRENYERVVAAGKDIIVHAWKKDREWFEEGDLACLFRSEN